MNQDTKAIVDAIAELCTLMKHLHEEARNTNQFLSELVEAAREKRDN